MDSLNFLLQDWLAILITVLIALFVGGAWIWFLAREGIKPELAVPMLVGFVVLTAIALGMIGALWGCRAYLMAHTTEANNPYAQAKEDEVMQTDDINYDLVEEIRKKREADSKQRRFEENRRKSEDARKASKAYLESLMGKEKEKEEEK